MNSSNTYFCGTKGKITVSDQVGTHKQKESEKSLPHVVESDDAITKV